MKNSVDIKFTRDRSTWIARQQRTQQDWYSEYRSSGAEYQMTYAEFKKQKQKQKRTRRSADAK